MIVRDARRISGANWMLAPIGQASQSAARGEPAEMVLPPESATYPVPLANSDHVAFVDLDLDLKNLFDINRRTWRLVVHDGESVVANLRGKRAPARLTRFVTGSAGRVLHLDGNPLNCLRANLRPRA